MMHGFKGHYMFSFMLHCTFYIHYILWSIISTKWKVKRYEFAYIYENVLIYSYLCLVTKIDGAIQACGRQGSLLVALSSNK
jgi:hypothetical protein